eukprot:TRINITY_DN1361_c0_g1_i11.p1 TRINITY_DN1361_c0_g1~~TRINITY_DN1361_c0_g1_i11.p1  ORF type:complete len:451 (-),score=194.56 TRINITY_DN1361_c0_g1_i11:34-1386(-)
MSFPKHYINPPQIVSQPKQLVSLTFQQNGLVSALEQLTSFFEYSHSVFSDLLKSIDGSYQKINELSSRIHNVTLNLPNVEFKFEQSSGEKDYLHTSMVSFKQDVGEKHSMFSKNSNNPSIVKRYETCFVPPPLAQLDPYRDPGEGKSCLKLYTNPNFFIEAWIAQQREEYEQKKERIAKRKQKRKEQQELNERNKKVEVKEMKLRRNKYQDNELGSTSSNSQQSTTQNYNSTPFTPMEQNQSFQPPPPQSNFNTVNSSSFPPPPQFNTPPPPNFGNTPPPPNFGNTPPPPQFNTPPPPNFGNTPPPPSFNPPPTPQFNTPPPPQFNNAPPPPQFNNPPPTPQFNNAPPPPQFNNAPPPPQFNNAPPPPQNTSSLGSALQEVSTGGGGGLLDQIRNGVNLKKKETLQVEQPKFEIVEDTSGFNTDLIGRVLAARREQLEDSCDDDDDGSWE